MKTFGTPDGPRHEVPDEERSPTLSRCGVKMQFRHHVRYDVDIEDVTCPKCLRLNAKGETRSWRSS